MLGAGLRQPIRTTRLRTRRRHCGASRKQRIRRYFGARSADIVPATRLCVQQIIRIKRAPQRSGLVPITSLPIGAGKQLAGDGFELACVLTLCINLEQLEINRGALRVSLERILQNLFGLDIAPIGHIHIRLCDRIDTFVTVDRSKAGLTEISLHDAAGAGIDTLPAGRNEHPLPARCQFASRTRADGQGLLAPLGRLNAQIRKQKCKNAGTTCDHGRVTRE